MHAARRPAADAVRPAGLRLTAASRAAAGAYVSAAALPRLVRTHPHRPVRPGGRGPDGLPRAPAGPRTRLRLRPAAGAGPGARGVHRVLPRPADHRGVRVRTRALLPRHPRTGRTHRGTDGTRRHPHDRRPLPGTCRAGRVPHRDRGRCHSPRHRLHVRRGATAQRSHRRRPAGRPRPRPGTARATGAGHGRGPAACAGHRSHRRAALLHRPVPPGPGRAPAEVPRRHDLLREEWGIGLRTPVRPMLRTAAEVPFLPRRSQPLARTGGNNR